MSTLAYTCATSFVLWEPLWALTVFHFVFCRGIKACTPGNVFWLQLARWNCPLDRNNLLLEKLVCNFAMTPDIYFKCTGVCLLDLRGLIDFYSDNAGQLICSLTLKGTWLLSSTLIHLDFVACKHLTLFPDPGDALFPF